MRIAVFHNLPSGGAKRVLWELSRLLRETHTLGSFAFATADQGFCDIRPFCGESHVFPFTPRTLLKRPLGRLNQLQRLRDLAGLRALGLVAAREIDGRGYDVVLVEPCMWTQAPSLLRYLGTPSVYHCHELPRVLYETAPLDPVMGWGTSGRRYLDRCDPMLRSYRRAARALDWANARSANVVVANSRFTGKLVQSTYGVTAEICYAGVDADAFRPASWSGGSDGGSVLSVGALRRNKGFSFLVEALSYIDERLRPALHIVSNVADETEQSRLESLARERGVKLRVDTSVPDAVLIEAYARAELVVYAPCAEPFGLVALEAMACARPVVAVAEGGVVETVVDGVTGYLVPRDARVFARAVADLLGRRDVALDMGRRGREVVQRSWSWAASAERFSTVLEDLVERVRCGTQRHRDGRVRG